MRSIRQIAWHAIDVYAEYCEQGYSTEAAREKAAREVMECYEEFPRTGTLQDNLRQSAEKLDPASARY